MVRVCLITHPVTGITMNKKDWATELNLTRTSFDKRLKKHPLLVALTPGKLPTGRDVWSTEEDEYLCSVLRTPNLYKRWNRIAEFRGWKLRSHNAIDTRISILKRQGAVDSRRDLDESGGWLTMSQLYQCLGISEYPVKLWITKGLKASRNGNLYKIHLKDFVTWACTPEGAALVGKAIAQNAIALTWLLVQVGNWMPEVKKKRHLEVA